MNAVWMLLACFLFATMGACIKLTGGYFNVGYTVGMRGLLPLLGIGLWVFWQRQQLASPHWKSHLYRSAAGSIAMLMYFSAISMLPLATAVTLNNCSALFLAAVVSIRQPPPRLVLICILLGFVGVILVLRPTFTHDQWLGGVLGIGSAAFACVAQLKLRALGKLGEPEWRTVFYLSCANFLLALPLAITRPAAPADASLAAWGFLLAVGVCGGVGQLALTRAFSLGRAIVASSLGYSTVVFSSLYGALLWHERIPPLSWLGMGLIIATSLTISRPATWARPGKPDGDDG